MGTLLRAARMATKAAEAMTTIAFAAMFVLFLVGIVMRYATDAPLAWSDELIMVIFLWTVFLTEALVITEREQITFDAVYDVVFLSEALASALLGVAFATWAFAPGQRRWIALGLGLGLATLCRDIYILLGAGTAVADRDEDTAPVRIVAVDRRLDERRARDRLCGAAGVVVRSGAFDRDLDQLARALAVAGELARQGDGDVLERGAQQRQRGRTRVDLVAATRAVREHDERVVWGSVAVHNEHVE